ncbi:hypothetical protein ETI09_11415, partial [Macrococcoides canis]|uniref:PKD domain-containing protein n=6 Tax=Macrococcoides canis TaxID=1855823 RepID=UPI0010CFCDDA
IGTPDIITDWNDDAATGTYEGTRDFSVTITVTDEAGNVTEETIIITVQRDTDGDGTPDVTDTDDDNDGIPDTEDNNPKVADTTAPTVDASDTTVTEGQAITPIPVTITDDNDTTEEVTGLPSGLTYDDANNQIIGTPDIITDWNDDAATGTYEGTRDFSVTITVTDEAGNVTEETIIITVQRDTDGDGTPDVTDTDDDNDGIPDTEDNNPKVADTTAPTVDASAATVTEGQAITPIPVTITDDNDTTEEVTGLPSGLTYDDANNQIIGTPDIITDWNDDAATGTYEGTRDFSVTITVTDEAGNVTEETIIITVQRDTDGDGTPDVTDTDDDNDGIPDTEDNNPKVADTTAPTVDASAATVTEGQAITPIPVTITDDNDTTEEVTGLPSGLTYDDANNQIIGTPDIITDWNDDAATGTYEGTRDFSVTITVTDEAGNVTEET